MENIEVNNSIETLNLVAIDNFNTEVESFYRLDSELAHKYTQSQEMINLIKKLAAQKKKFYEFYNENISGETGLVISFFTKMLNMSEIYIRKDLMDYNAEEVIQAIVTMAKEGSFTSKSTYGACLSIIHHYFRWGYQQSPKLKTFVISSSELPEYKDIMNIPQTSQKILTQQEMIVITQRIENIMADCIISLATDGLKLDEIINLEINTIKNKVLDTGEINTGDRIARLSPHVYEKALSVAMLKKVDRILVNGNIKALRLSNTPYLIRFFERKDANLYQPPTKSVVSGMVSTELGKAGYNGTFNDFRISCIVNDIYKLYKDKQVDKTKVYLMINKKYGLNMQNPATIRIRYGIQLDILTEKYSQ